MPLELQVIPLINDFYQKLCKWLRIISTQLLYSLFHFLLYIQSGQSKKPELFWGTYWLEVLWKPDGRWPLVIVWGGEFRHGVGPHPGEGRALGHTGVAVCVGQYKVQCGAVYNELLEDVWQELLHKVT